MLGFDRKVVPGLPHIRKKSDSWLSHVWEQADSSLCTKHKLGLVLLKQAGEEKDFLHPAGRGPGLHIQGERSACRLRSQQKNKDMWGYKMPTVL